MHPYLISLASEYIELVESMRHGRYTAAELRELDSQRQVTHNQLCEVTGLDRNEDMYAHAKAVLITARATGSRS